MDTTNKQAVGYVRVSTEEQATEGVSLEAQELALRAYAAMRGFELVELVRDEGVSAGKALATREGGRRVLELVRGRKVAAVIGWKLDRLFRDCADCLLVTADWDKRAVSLHLIDMGGQAVDTSSAMGRFFLTVMAGAAELERNQVRDRTSAAMAHKASKGEYTGGQVPYGYRLDGARLVADDAEQAVLTVAMDAHAEGLSLRAIARRLAERGFTPRTGKGWHASTVRQLVTREPVRAALRVA